MRKIITAVLILCALFDSAETAFAQSGMPYWVIQTGCVAFGDSACPPYMPVALFTNTGPGSRPTNMGAVSNVEFATTSQLDAKVDATLKALTDAIRNEYAKIALGELETRLLDRISALEKRLAEVESAKPKAVPSSKVSQSTKKNK